MSFFRGASLFDDNCKVKKELLGYLSIFDFFLILEYLLTSKLSN